MKTKHPKFEVFDYEVTPDYAPRMARVAMSARVRDNGRQLSQNRMVRSSWKSSSISSEPVALSFTEVERGQIEPIEIDDVDLDLIGSDSLEALSPIASYDAVLKFESKITQGQFTPTDEAENVMSHFPTEDKAVQTGSIRVIEKPLIFFDDEPLCEDENDFPLIVRRKLKGRAIVRGAMPNHFEPDEALCE